MWKWVFILVLGFSFWGCSPLLKSSDDRPPRKTTFDPYCFPDFDLCAAVVPKEVPIPVNRETVFRLKFWQISTGSATGPYVDPALHPRLWLWMPMATGSHGSPYEIEVVQTAVGEYEAEQVFFSMAGEWQLFFGFESGRSKVEDVVQFIWI